MCYLDICRTNC